MPTMSGLPNSSLDGSTSNLPDSKERPFTTSIAAQSAAARSFHLIGNFNVQKTLVTLASRNSAMSGVRSVGVQQPGGSISSGRFTSNNVPVPINQISHTGSHVNSGWTNRGGTSIVEGNDFGSSVNVVGGSIPGISLNSGTAGSRNAVPPMGASPNVGNKSPRIANSVGRISGAGSMGRSIRSGGLSIPAHAMRMNLAAKSGSASFNVQGPNRSMNGMLQQAFGGQQSQVANKNPMDMLNNNCIDGSPFKINDFPQLSGRSNSAGGRQGQLDKSSLRKQGVGVRSIVQQSQEFSIQNEDFPPLPGCKDLLQKEKLPDKMPAVQSHHFPIARSSGFSLGGTYSSNRQQQLHATSVGTGGISFATGDGQDFLHLHGSDLLSSSHMTYHSQVQNTSPTSIGLRPPASSSAVSGMRSYEHFIQHDQHQQIRSQFQFQQKTAALQPFSDRNIKSFQTIQTTPDRSGLIDMLTLIRMNHTDLMSLTIGIDLTTLGLNLNSSDYVCKAFASPWSDEPLEREPEYCIPNCYHARRPPLQQGHFARFPMSTLFYIFYSMPKDKAQVYAAHELYRRGWLYHKEHKFWFTRVANMEHCVKSQTYETGSYLCFDQNSWNTIRKDNFVLHYDAIEKKPTLPPTWPLHRRYQLSGPRIHQPPPFSIIYERERERERS